MGWHTVDGGDDDVDEGGGEACDHAPAQGQGQHAVCYEHYEQNVPHQVLTRVEP